MGLIGERPPAPTYGNSVHGIVAVNNENVDTAASQAPRTMEQFMLDSYVYGPGETVVEIVNEKLERYGQEIALIQRNALVIPDGDEDYHDYGEDHPSYPEYYPDNHPNHD